MKKILFFGVILAVALLFGGCSANKGKVLKTPVTPTKQQTNTTGKVAYPAVTSKANKIEIGPITNRQQLERAIKLLKIKREIHFKFNSYALEPIDEYGIKENPKEILDRIADFMRKHPNIRLRIEGNCDERGTEEYNLALGQKRANAAKRYLVSKGISPDRIYTISYGESQPVDPGHNPYAWAKNRRDHFVFLIK